MGKNRRKVYCGDGENGEERESKPCPACGCRHVERSADRGKAVTRCRHCGRVR